MDEHEVAVEPVDVATYEPAGALLKALTAPVRIAIIDLISKYPLCVHELVDALGVTQPLVSQHLKVLRAARLVKTEKRGREVVYLMSDDHVSHIVRDAITHTHE